MDACLQTLKAQDYPGEIEIVVADGDSTDDTVERVEEWQTRLSLLRLIRNPRRIQSHGLNLAAEQSTGEILIRADAHTTYPPDYVRLTVDRLESSDATVVGGIQDPVRAGGFGDAVAIAMKSRIASGPARFRHATRRSEVDTVYLGGFRKADFVRLGGFRELPSRVAEDADLYFRWRRQGAKVVADPAIVAFYTPRDTVAGLWRQYYLYGLAKADMLYVNGRWPSMRPLAPLTLILALLGGAGLAATGRWVPLAAVMALWQGALLVAARARPRVMLAASIMHLAYGSGLVRGLMRRPASVRGRVS